FHVTGVQTCALPISADPSIWARTGHEMSIAAVFSRHGIDFVPANNDRVSGWIQCRQRLGVDAEGRRMFVVSRMCKHFIRTIPTLVHSETRPEIGRASCRE